jgi:hypothetical protein
VVLLIQDRRLWFFRDDFGFLLDTHLSHRAVTTLLSPHNEHWSTFPLLAFRAMWHLFGLRHYLPYALMPLLLHGGLAICLTVLMRRAGVGPWPAVLGGLVFAYLAGGAGAENTLWAFQIGFIGSCLAGVLALICLDTAAAHDDYGWRNRWFWAGEAALIAALMCSGMGVPMVITAGAWGLLRRHWVYALRVVAVPFVIYVLWYVGWGHRGFASAPSLSAGLERAPAAAARGVVHVWSAAIGIPGAGALMLVALVVCVVLARHRRRLAALGAAGLIGLLAEFLIVGFGRSEVDAGYVLHSRYLYVGLVLTSPAVACGLDLLSGRLRGVPRIRTALWPVVAVLVVVVGSAETARFATARRAEDPNRRQDLLAAGVLIRTGAPLLSDRIDPTDLYRDPAMSVSNLKAAHALGELPSGRPSSRALFDERSVLQANVQEHAMSVPLAARYHWFAAPGVSTGCATHDTTHVSRIDVPLGAHDGQVAVDFLSRASGAVHTWIVQGGRRSIRSAWPLTARWQLAGRQVHVASTMHHATLDVTLPAGRIEVCGRR